MVSKYSFPIDSKVIFLFFFAHFVSPRRLLVFCVIFVCIYILFLHLFSILFLPIFLHFPPRVVNDHLFECPSLDALRAFCPRQPGEGDVEEPRPGSRVLPRGPRPAKERCPLKMRSFFH